MGSMSVVGVEKEITESVYNNLHLVDGTCIEFINSQKLKRNNTSGACGIYKLKNNKYIYCYIKELKIK